MGHPAARLRSNVADRLALDAYGLPVAFSGVGLLNYVFVPRLATSFREMRRAVDAEVDALLRDGPSQGEVCRSVRHEQRERLAALATNEGVAAAIARGALLHGDARAFERELRALGDLDAKAVHRAARRFLGPGASTLVIEPEGAMGWIKTVLEWLPAGLGASLESSFL